MAVGKQHGEIALAEARRALDMQVATVDSIRTRSTGVLAVVALAAGVVKLPPSGPGRILPALLGLALVGVIAYIAWPRGVRTNVDPDGILAWDTVDEADVARWTAHWHGVTYREQVQAVARIGRAYNAVVVLTGLLALSFITWGVVK